jgi:hypothetical protein
MFWRQQVYSTLHPMAPFGGLFVATIGFFLVLGAMLPALRMKLTYVGFVAGTLALLLGGRLAVGLPAPSKFQLSSLVLAIALEIVLFVALMPRMRRIGERAVLVATLAIVSIHFLVMLPAFGPLIGALGVLCLLNASIAWRNRAYPIGVAWVLDGAIKLVFGILLVMTSPFFSRGQ